MSETGRERERKRCQHENSVEAWGEVDVETRRAEVLRAYAECGALTDREVMVRLSHRDPNAVRPRITELVKSGHLIEIGKRRDVVSGRRVRVCRLHAEAMQLELAI